MAITMSGASIDSSERENLLSSEVDTSIVSGGETANKGGFMGWVSGGLFGEESGATLAGVTKSFASNVTNAIDTYKTEVQTKLDKLQAVESNSAFKGAAVSAALAKFITSVRDVGKQYLDKLSAAETQIINSVAAAYQTQDTDLSGNLNSDASSLG